MIQSPQLELQFISQVDKDKHEQERENAIAIHKSLWKACWDWDGPKIWQPIEIDTCCVADESGKSHYCYMAPCIIEKEIKKDTWLAVLDYDESWPEDCIEQNGMKLILDVLDIWAPTRILTKQRKNEDDSNEQ